MFELNFSFRMRSGHTYSATLYFLKNMFIYLSACILLIAACVILFPDPRSSPGPLHWVCRLLATGPPGKFQHSALVKSKIKQTLQSKGKRTPTCCRLDSLLTTTSFFLCETEPHWDRYSWTWRWSSSRAILTGHSSFLYAIYKLFRPLLSISVWKELSVF